MKRAFAHLAAVLGPAAILLAAAAAASPATHQVSAQFEVAGPTSPLAVIGRTL